MDQFATTIEDLPDEILLQIFSKLSPRNILREVVEVCCRWRQLVDRDTLFWRHLQCIVDCNRFFGTSYLSALSSDVHDNPYTCDDRFIYIGEKDLQKVPNIKFLKFEGNYKSSLQPAMSTVRILDTIFNICKYIEQFESLHCFGSTSAVFINFLNSCYKNISDLRFGITSVYRISYEQLFHFENLQTFVSHDYRLNQSDLYVLANKCEQLSCVWILFSRFVHTWDIDYFIDVKKGKLKELGIGLTVNDSILDKISECVNLNVLFVADARQVTAKGLKNLKKLPSLKYISLHRMRVSCKVLIDWILSSEIYSQLAIFDFTDYYFSRHAVAENLRTATDKMCPLTFSNDLNKAVGQPYRPWERRVHWMYYNVLCIPT